MRWIEARGNIAVLQVILGHRDITTTMRYARVTDGLMCAEAAEVESWIEMTVLENFDLELGIDRRK